MKSILLRFSLPCFLLLACCFFHFGGRHVTVYAPKYTEDAYESLKLGTDLEKCVADLGLPLRAYAYGTYETTPEETKDWTSSAEEIPNTEQGLIRNQLSNSVLLVLHYSRRGQEGEFYKGVRLNFKGQKLIEKTSIVDYSDSHGEF